MTTFEEIEAMRVSDEAKNEIKELHSLCMALGGNFRASPPRTDIEDHFASIGCSLPKEKLLTEVRLSSAKLELIGIDDWHTFHGPSGFLSMVVWSTRKAKGEIPKQLKVSKFYLDNSVGVDQLEGEIKLNGIHAYVQDDGKYVNMELV